MPQSNTRFWPARTDSVIHFKDEVLSVLIGAGVTAGLFLAMAHFQAGGGSKPQIVLEELRPVSIPLETPPPVTPVTNEPVSATITGIEVAPAESPVHIAVSLPVLENLPIPVAPPAKIQTSTIITDFKPKVDLTTDFQHVFQVSEVDQRPSVLVNTSPFIPHTVRRNAEMLRVVLLMVVDTKGEASNIRVLNTSGNKEFDALIVECVRDEWVFSPAIKKGHKVKCLVQRAITIKWSTSPFES